MKKKQATKNGSSTRKSSAKCAAAGKKPAPVVGMKYSIKAASDPSPPRRQSGLPSFSGCPEYQEGERNTLNGRGFVLLLALMDYLWGL